MLEYDVDLARSCGQVRPITLSVRLQDRPGISKYVITKPYAILGRNTSCDICLHHEDVSKQHAYLQVLDGKLFCIDQGSRHGIFWKETPQLYGWIAPRQTIEIGPYAITLEEPVGADAQAKHPRNTAPFYARFTPYENPSAAYLEINGNRQFELNHQLALIGRSQHCNVILDTNEISPIHASIVRTRDGKYWLVVPIGIKVKVNHKRCVSMELHDGDVINVGNHTLSFKLSDIPLVQRVSAGSSGKIELPGHIQFHLEEPKTGPLTAPPTPSPSLIEIETRTDLAQFRSQERLTAQDISLDDLLNESNPSGIQLDTLPPDQPAAPSTALMERPASELTRQPGSVERNLTEAHATDLISPADSSLQLPSEAQLAAKPDSSSKSEIQLMDVFLDHMKSMQAEMMTQMRMNMEMMANFMVNLQQQHMEQVREELNHLNQINQELLYLRQCLLTTPKPGKSSALQKASSELTVADLEPVEPPEKQMAYKPVVLPPGNSTLPVPLEQRAQITGKTKRSKAPATPAPEPATASTQPDSPWPGNYTPTGPKESGPAASGPAPSHDWITKRIATLEGERQSRWEKMRQAVFGK